jgi:glutamyl-Q tRNA(Asp) synthetase
MNSRNMAASRARDKPAYRGRFAPSPTGPLHLGSLTAAVASYLQSRSNQGRWLVRIEDIDPPRELAGAAADQIETLAAFGMVSDEPVTYQSRSGALHERAIAHLRAAGLAYDCGCSRRDLPASGVYPGTCRNGIPEGRAARSIRFRIPETPVTLADRVYGTSVHRLDEICGDFVIRRADGLVAYQLAVVVDDIDAGITEIVRGSDLLDSSPRQQALYAALEAPAPDWLHLPLIVDRKGDKLSKSTHADPVGKHAPVRAMAMALTALGHRPPRRRGLQGLWDWAIANWEPARIPREPFELSL